MYFLWTSFQTSEELLPVPKPQDVIEEKMVQKLGPSSPNKVFTVDQEIELACEEADCVRYKCRHISPKGEKIYDNSCLRQCSKERCKKRCKREPTISTVTREIKRDKCLESCPDDNSDKSARCSQFCHDEFKTCKDRCKERSKRYFCVRDLDKLEKQLPVDPATLLQDDLENPI